MVKTKYLFLPIVLILAASCNVNQDAYTLYKINPESASERVEVKVFSTESTSDGNLAACHKYRNEIISKDPEAPEKYWCEKGG